MSETKNPGEKKLSVSGKTLTLKPRTESGVVRQSFSHGRSKQVVVEKVKRRVVGGPGEAKAEAAPVVETKKAAAAPAASQPTAASVKPPMRANAMKKCAASTTRKPNARPVKSQRNVSASTK